MSFEGLVAFSAFSPLAVRRKPTFLASRRKIERVAKAAALSSGVGGDKHRSPTSSASPPDWCFPDTFCRSTRPSCGDV